MTPRTSYSVLELPLPLAGASGDRSAVPFSVSRVCPCTSPTVSTVVTCTVRTHVAVVPSSSVDVMVTAYVPAGTAALTVTVALAVPPSTMAGVKAVRLIVPAAGVGVTFVRARSTIVSSASVAVTVRVALVPADRVSAPPQARTAGWSPPVVVCAPSPSKVSVAKPSHSTAGSKASPPLVSPASTLGLRRSVLSIVLVSPVPHSVPGSTPIWPIESTMVRYRRP